MRGFRSKAWPCTDAIVIVSGVIQSSDTEGGRLYRVNIQYRFLVDEIEWIGTRVYFGDWLLSPLRMGASRLARRFPVESHVAVRYNRAQPEDSVILTGFHASVLYGAVLGGIRVPWLAGALAGLTGCRRATTVVIKQLKARAQ